MRTRNRTGRDYQVSPRSDWRALLGVVVAVVASPSCGRSMMVDIIPTLRRQAVKCSQPTRYDLLSLERVLKSMAFQSSSFLLELSRCETWTRQVSTSVGRESCVKDSRFSLTIPVQRRTADHPLVVCIIPQFKPTGRKQLILRTIFEPFLSIDHSIHQMG